MQLQGNIRILRRILRRPLNLHLIKTYPARSLAGDFVIADRSDAQMPQRKTIHIMRAMGFKHVGLQQGVMDDAVQYNAMIGKMCLSYLRFCPSLDLAIFSQGLSLSSTRSTRQLRRGTRIAVRKRQVSRLMSLNGKRDADELRLHRIQPCRFRIQRNQRRSIDTWIQSSSWAGVRMV